MPLSPDVPVIRNWAQAHPYLEWTYREGNQVWLQPANSQMTPLYVDAVNVGVQGKMVGVIRMLYWIYHCSGRRGCYADALLDPLPFVSPARILGQGPGLAEPQG